MVESSIPKKQPGSASRGSSVIRHPIYSNLTPKRSPRPSSSKRIIRLARETQDGSSLPHPTPRSPRRESGGLRLLSVWLICALVVIGVGGISAKWLVRTWTQNSCQDLLPRTSDSERLYCIQLAVESGDLESLIAAMSWVGSWGEDHPLFLEGQHLLQNWSKAMFAEAKQQLQRGNLEKAIGFAEQIPVKSPLYPEVKVAIANWRQEWQQGKDATQNFELALQKQDWNAARERVQDVGALKQSYWRTQKVNQLLLRLSKEQEGMQKLETARELAQSQNPDSLAEAIASAKQLDPNTYAQRIAQKEQDRWGRELLKIASERLESEDFAGAIATAEAIPQDNALYGEAQDWITLSRASEVAKQDDINALLAALETVRQIDPQSPLFHHAKTRAQLWQAKIQG